MSVLVIYLLTYVTFDDVSLVVKASCDIAKDKRYTQLGKCVPEKERRSTF